jgi:rhamnosyl/mannosyltransferase
MNEPHQLRVLHLGKFYHPYLGGIETHLQALVEETSQMVDSTVIVANESLRTSVDFVHGIRVIRAGRLCTVSRAPICPSMVWHTARTPADVVHIHLPNPVAVIAYLASGHPGRLVLTEHGEIFGRRLLRAAVQPFMAAALKRASAVIATSPNYLPHSSVLSAVPHKCRVIPYGIDAARFEHPDAARIAAIRPRHRGPVFLAIGRLVHFKGFEYLIRAMAGVSGTLLLIGDGPLRNQLRELSRESGVADRVHFLGPVPNEDVVPYLQAADIFVLPSIENRESFGIVQLEAMACGKPVINTNLPSGVPYASLHGVTGLTVNPRDADALAQAMQALVRDPGLRARFGTAGRERVRSEFTVGIMARRTVELYRQVLEEPKAVGQSAWRAAYASGRMGMVL